MEKVRYAYNNVNFLTWQVHIHYSRDWQLYTKCHDFFPDWTVFFESNSFNTVIIDVTRKCKLEKILIYCWQNSILIEISHSSKTIKMMAYKIINMTLKTNCLTFIMMTPLLNTFNRIFLHWFADVVETKGTEGQSQNISKWKSKQKSLALKKCFKWDLDI